MYHIYYDISVQQNLALHYELLGNIYHLSSVSLTNFSTYLQRIRCENLCKRVESLFENKINTGLAVLRVNAN